MSHEPGRKGLWVFLFLLLAGFQLLTGCSTLIGRKPMEEEIPAKEWDARNYSDFLKQNMMMLNQIYSTVYHPYVFIVDTAQGSVPIQHLIDSRAVTPIVEDLRIGDNPEEELIWRLYRYVIEEYEYVVDASYWPEISDTLEKKEGDCKGLSLLLLSLFHAAGYDGYAAISNGHMWVRGSDGGKWYTFEVDRDPGRSQIYGIKGFYENPLFKVFNDRTYKRKRK